MATLSSGDLYKRYARRYHGINNHHEQYTSMLVERNSIRPKKGVSRTAITYLRHQIIAIQAYFL
ncbi:hypothetical protein DM02DRAFT_619387, partial [Periconia macrospinosa]